MQPAPTRMDAPPRLSSQPSWSPAVAPPPVAGAAVGNGRGECVRAGDGRVRELGVVVRLRPGPGADDVLPPEPEGLGGPGLGVFTAGVWLGETGAEAVAPADTFGSVTLGGDPLQAATDAEVTIVRAAKPAAATLTRNPVPPVVTRGFPWLLILRKASRGTQISRQP